MKMKYQLQGFEMKFGAGEKIDGAIKVDGLEIEQEFELQEKKFNEELRRNRRIFNKKESQ